MKRILSILLVLALNLLLIMPHIYAVSNELTVEEMVNSLKKTGMTELTLDKLSDKDIENLYNAMVSGDVEIIVEKKSAYMDPISTGVSTFGLINENNFDIEIAPIIKYTDNRIEFVYLLLVWQWDGSHPAARWEDVIKVSWDKSKFSYSGDFVKTDYYYTHLGTEKVMGTDTSPAEIDQGNIAFYTDLYNLLGVDRGGICTFQLKPAIKMTKGKNYTTSVTTTYYHNASLVPLVNSISIGYADGAIDISYNNNLTDTLPDHCEIPYNKK